MRDPLNSLQLDDVTIQLDRLAAAYGRKKPDLDTAEIWLERMREANVRVPELKRACDWTMDRKERFPSLSQVLEAVFAERTANAGAGDDARRKAEVERPDDYEAWRQATKARLGIGAQNRSDEHKRRYGKAIEPAKYIPPHLRKQMTGDPDETRTPGGPRPLI